MVCAAGGAVVGIGGAPYDRSRYCPYALEVRRDRAQWKVDRARHVRLPYDELRVRVEDVSKDVDMTVVSPASVPMNAPTPTPTPTPAAPVAAAATKPGQPPINLAAPPATQAVRQFNRRVVTLPIPVPALVPPAGKQ